MKKLIKNLFLTILISGIGAAVSSCNKGDIDDLNERVDKIEKDVTDLKTLTESLDKQIKDGKLITSVTTVADGFQIKFSDDSTITVTNGIDGTDGTDGTNGKTPYVTIEEGKWVVYPNGQGTTEKTVLGSAVGAAGANGSYVTVAETEGLITITSFSGAGAETGKYTIDTTGSSLVVVDTDYWVQFNVTKDEVTTGYRIGKTVVVPTTIKILTPIVQAPVAIDQTASIDISVSPSNALVNPDLVYFDFLSEGWITRAETPADFYFDDIDCFTILSTTPREREGEYTIEFAFNGNALYSPTGNEMYGAEEIYPEIFWGEKFDVCLAFVKNPASISKVVVDGTEPAFEIDYGYSRSVNSFTYTDEAVYYNEGDAYFDPTSGEATSVDTGVTETAILWKEGLEYPEFINLANPVVTMMAHHSNGDEMGIPKGTASDYIVVTPMTGFTPLDPATRILGKYSLKIADGGAAAFDAFAAEQAFFIPGSYIEFTFSVDASSSHGAGSETLEYTYKVHYIKTHAELADNMTVWLPNSTTAADLGAFDAVAPVNTLGFTAVAANLSMTDYTVEKWDAAAATPAWVASEKSYFTPTFNADAEIEVTMETAVQPGVYTITYSVVIEEITTFLTQRVNVVVPDYTIALKAVPYEGYDTAGVGAPFLNYYAEDLAAEIAIEDLIDAATIAAAKPAAATVDGETYPQVAADVPTYTYAPGGHIVGNNVKGLVSDKAKVVGAPDLWDEFQTFTLSVNLATEQTLPVKVIYGAPASTLFTNTVKVKINSNFIIEDSIATALLTAEGVFNTTVNYFTAQATAVDLTGVLASVKFRNPVDEYDTTRAEETVATYANIKADSRVASVVFEAGELEVVNEGDQLPPVTARPLVAIDADGKLKTVSYTLTDAQAPVYQNVTVTVTDVWGNSDSAVFKVMIVFNDAQPVN